MEKPPFIVRTSGFIDGPLRKKHNPHVHSTPGTKQGDFLLTLFIDGEGRYVNNSMDIKLTKGLVGLVPPDDPGVLMSSRAVPYRHYYCRFTGTYARQMAREILSKQDSLFFTHSETVKLAQLLHQMGFVSNLRYRFDLPEKMGFREALLAQILVILNSEEEPVRSKDILTPEQISDLLSDRIGDPTDVGHFASALSVSKNTLMRKTRQFFGKTVLQLHEELKMEWAKQLLSLEMLNVSETSHRLGYKDPLYFSRKFKKIFGKSPTSWKKDYQRGNN